MVSPTNHFTHAHNHHEQRPRLSKISQFFYDTSEEPVTIECYKGVKVLHSGIYDQWQSRLKSLRFAEQRALRAAKRTRLMQNMMKWRMAIRRVMFINATNRIRERLEEYNQRTSRVSEINLEKYSKSVRTKHYRKDFINATLNQYGFYHFAHHPSSSQKTYSHRRTLKSSQLNKQQQKQPTREDTRITRVMRKKSSSKKEIEGRLVLSALTLDELSHTVRQSMIFNHQNNNNNGNTELISRFSISNLFCIDTHSTFQTPQFNITDQQRKVLKQWMDFISRFSPLFQSNNNISNDDHFSDRFLKALERCKAMIKTYNTERIIFRSGDIANRVYLVLEGAIELWTDQESYHAMQGQIIGDDIVDNADHQSSHSHSYSYSSRMSCGLSAIEYKSLSKISNGNQNNNSQWSLVKIANTGEFCGEISIRKSSSNRRMRCATGIASKQSTLLLIDIYDFQRYIRPLISEYQNNIEEEKEEREVNMSTENDQVIHHNNNNNTGATTIAKTLKDHLPLIDSELHSLLFNRKSKLFIGWENMMQFGDQIILPKHSMIERRKMISTLLNTRMNNSSKKKKKKYMKHTTSMKKRKYQNTMMINEFIRRYVGGVKTPLNTTSNNNNHHHKHMNGSGDYYSLSSSNIIDHRSIQPQILIITEGIVHMKYDNQIIHTFQKGDWIDPRTIVLFGWIKKNQNLYHLLFDTTELDDDNLNDIKIKSNTPMKLTNKKNVMQQWNQIEFECYSKSVSLLRLDLNFLISYSCVDFWQMFDHCNKILNKIYEYENNIKLINTQAKSNDYHRLKLLNISNTLSNKADSRVDTGLRISKSESTAQLAQTLLDDYDVQSVHTERGVMDTLRHLSIDDEKNDEYSDNHRSLLRNTSLVNDPKMLRLGLDFTRPDSFFINSARIHRDL